MIISVWHTVSSWIPLLVLSLPAAVNQTQTQTSLPAGWETRTVTDISPDTSFFALKFLLIILHCCYNRELIWGFLWVIYSQHHFYTVGVSEVGSTGPFILTTQQFDQHSFKPPSHPARPENQPQQDWKGFFFTLFFIFMHSLLSDVSPIHLRF